MRLALALTIAACLPSVAIATTPPRDAPFSEKACRATHVFSGTASDFKVVAVPACDDRGNGKHLSMCEEVEVQVTVDQVRVPADWRPTAPVTFRFGGGLFSVDDLRRDLVGKPRYYFTTVTDEGSVAVHRTSYAWFLGAPDTPETAEAIDAALPTCAGKRDASLEATN